jgi:hypothetical protein
MSEAVGCPLDDEQPESEPVGARRVEKRLEYAVQLVWWNALACIMNLDTNGRRAPPASNENAPAGRRVIQRVSRY